MIIGPATAPPASITPITTAPRAPLVFPDLVFVPSAAAAVAALRLELEREEPIPRPPPAPANDVEALELEELEDNTPASPLARLRAGRWRTLPAKHLSRDERRAAALVVYPDDVERPRTRGDCQGGPRPCPFVTCSMHLYLDVNPETGSIKFNFPGLEVWEMPETCALDVADRGGTTLEGVGALIGLTRERVRQVELAIGIKVRRRAPELLEMLRAALELAGHADEPW